MFEPGQVAGFNEQTLLVAMTLKEIDGLIKNFVKDVCKDMGVDAKDLFYKTEVKDGCYVLSLFRSADKTMTKFGWTMEAFLEICSNKDKIEHEFNTVIRKLILNLDVKSDNPIWVSK